MGSSPNSFQRYFKDKRILSLEDWTHMGGGGANLQLNRMAILTVLAEIILFLEYQNVYPGYISYCFHSGISESMDQ